MAKGKKNKKSNDPIPEDPKRKKNFIVIFIGAVVVINIIAISVVAEIASHHRKVISYELSSSDVILLEESVSSTWCTGQTVVAPLGANVQVYKTNKLIEKYNHADRINIAVVNGTLDPFSSKSFRFFLLGESSIRVSGCSNLTAVHLRVFKNSTLSTGCEAKFNNRCPSKSIMNTDLKICPKLSSELKPIDKNSFVYTVLQNLGDTKVKMNFNITLHRIIYDLEQMKLECIVNGSCKVSLQDSNQLVLHFVAKNRVMHDVESITVTTQCHLRILNAFAYYCYMVFPTVIGSGIGLYAMYTKQSKKDFLIPLLPK